MSRGSIEGEAIPEKFPYLLVLITSVLLGFLGSFWYLLGRSGLGFWTSLDLFSAITSITIADALLLIIPWAFSRLKFFKERINIKTLGYLYMIGVCSAYYLVLLNDPIVMVVGSRILMSEELSLKYVPLFLAPPKSVVEGIMLGKAPFEFDVWIPVLAFWWVLYTIPAIFLISVATLFRRHWIEVEKVPFPCTSLMYQFLITIPSPSSSNRRRSIFTIGLIVGVVFQGIVLLTQLFPWFPDIFAVRGNCCGYVWYVKSTDVVAPIIGLGTANLQPIMAAVAYFVPLTILFNCWFWYLVYCILMQVAHYMGYYTGAESAGGCGRGWCAPYSGLLSAPYKFMAISQVGGMIGLTVITLWLSRSYIYETLKAALSRSDVERLSKIESGEPLSYRWIWILLILSFIGTIGVFMAMGIGFAAALLMPITFFIFYFANTRLYGLSGFYMRGMEHGPALHKALIWPTRPEPPTREFTLTMVFVRTNTDTSSGKLFGSIFGAAASYKMASLTGISTRNTFKVLLITALIVPVASLISVFIIAGYAIGLNNLGGGPYRLLSLWGLSLWGECSDYNARIPVVGSWVEYAILGFVIVCVLSWLHYRFVWFPFEPIGFLNGTSYNSLISGLWTSYLVAWIFKTITLRVGGSRAYEEFGVPLASGITIGCLTVFIIGGIVGIIRFFVPF